MLYGLDLTDTLVVLNEPPLRLFDLLNQWVVTLMDFGPYCVILFITPLLLSWLCPFNA